MSTFHVLASWPAPRRPARPVAGKSEPPPVRPQRIRAGARCASRLRSPAMGRRPVTLAEERLRHARLSGAVQAIEDLTRLDHDSAFELSVAWPELWAHLQAAFKIQRNED